jgi:hypothetical protein
MRPRFIEDGVGISPEGDRVRLVRQIVPDALSPASQRRPAEGAKFLHERECADQVSLRYELADLDQIRFSKR